jgi:hypothetical protein
LALNFKTRENAAVKNGNKSRPITEAVLIIVVLLGLTIAVPSLFFAFLGFQGRLSDTSEEHNFNQGLGLLCIGLVGLLSAAYCRWQLAKQQ